MLELQCANETSVITCMIFKSQDIEIIDISMSCDSSTFDKKDMYEYTQ